MVFLVLLLCQMLELEGLNLSLMLPSCVSLGKSSNPVILNLGTVLSQGTFGNIWRHIGCYKRGQGSLLASSHK